MTLVTGGAGYIGSHTVLALKERGREVVVLDDLSEGHRSAVVGATLEVGTLLDRDFVNGVFDRHEVDSVFHFAAKCLVGESVQDPGKYWSQNVVATLNLLDAMVAHQTKRVVLSSTAATYGEVTEMPIVEDVPQQPCNPYGDTKLACERMLQNYHRAFGMDSAALRYFNAAGADPEGRVGEDHEHETHLIPNVIRAALGAGPALTVFGDDWDTPDGTCVRDYVHVVDLAHAHILALEAMEKGMSGAAAFNLGNTAGTSVNEIIQAVEDVGGRPVPRSVGPRRPGDPAVLVGSSARIEKELGWSPRFGDTRTIVETAWRWHESHPQGFGDA
ncbi:MAG: UDP-glucose 4-epimerase GalE [Planctomycetota bacterium]